VREFTMPSLGADMDAGTLAEWLVQEGDTVHRGDPIAVVDTEKSAIEVESFDDGVVERFLVEPGTRVPVGTPLARLAPVGAAAATPLAPAAESEPTSTEARVPAPRAPLPRHPGAAPPLRHHAAELGVDIATVVGTGPHGGVTRADVDRAAARMRNGDEHVGPSPTVAPEAPAEPVALAAHAAPGRRASPYARRLAKELGVDLAEVRGTGPGGSVRGEDVAAASRSSAPQRARSRQPTAEAVPEPVERPGEHPGGEPVAARESGRATIAALMSRAKREIPHYYVATTVDLTATTTWLRRTNKERPVSERLVPAAVILKSTALAAREHPELNGFWVDGGFVAGEDVHLGVAVRVRGGALVAPAIHHAADLDLTTLMASLRDLVRRARAGRLRRAEMADPTLTVTDLGDQGVEEVIGVIYPPQVALLGVGRIVERPWAADGMIGARPTVRLTLSGDHRATDGATGARFLNTLEQHLQHPEEL
jgi:pyruvate dehydrogenase E2 component (dihydrolipoamide acetyltransferase)